MSTLSPPAGFPPQRQGCRPLLLLAEAATDMEHIPSQTRMTGSAERRCVAPTPYPARRAPPAESGTEPDWRHVIIQYDPESTPTRRIFHLCYDARVDSVSRFWQNYSTLSRRVGAKSMQTFVQDAVLMGLDLRFLLSPAQQNTRINTACLGKMQRKGLHAFHRLLGEEPTTAPIRLPDGVPLESPLLLTFSHERTPDAAPMVVAQEPS